MTVATLVRRNLTIYVRDTTAVVLSLLGALILLALYALFLGTLQVDTIREKLPDASTDDIRYFVDSWVYAGIVMISTFTTGLAALDVFVEDRTSGRFKEFLVSPVRRSQLVVGYLVSTVVVAVLMSTVVLVAGEVLLLVLFGRAPSALDLLAGFGCVCLLAAAFSAFSAFLVTFVRSTGAFSSLSTIVGTVLGFLAGAYIPLGALDRGVTDVINALPFSQAAMLVRHPLTRDALDRLTDGRPQAADPVRAFYGIDISLGGHAISPAVAGLVLALVVVVFTSAAVARLRGRIR